MAQQTVTTERIEYGDQFRHVITGDVKTVHDARKGEEKIVWADGSWDYREDIVAAVKGDPSLYEVEALGEDTFVPEEH
jgi:hypothetical protein